MVFKQIKQSEPSFTQKSRSFQLILLTKVVTMSPSGGMAVQIGLRIALNLANFA